MTKTIDIMRMAVIRVAVVTMLVIVIVLEGRVFMSSKVGVMFTEVKAIHRMVMYGLIMYLQIVREINMNVRLDLIRSFTFFLVID